MQRSTFDLDDPVPCPRISGSMSGMASSPSSALLRPRPRTQRKKGPRATVICLDRERLAAAPEAKPSDVETESFQSHAADHRGAWARPRAEARKPLRGFSFKPVHRERNRDLAKRLGRTRFITTTATDSTMASARELRSVIPTSTGKGCPNRRYMDTGVENNNNNMK